MSFVLHTHPTLVSEGRSSMLFTSPVLNKSILEGCVMGRSSEQVSLSWLFTSSPSHSIKISTNTLQGNTTRTKTVTSNHPFTLGHPYWETAVSKAPPQYAKQVKLILPSLGDICRHIIPSWIKGRDTAHISPTCQNTDGVAMWSVSLCTDSLSWALGQHWTWHFQTLEKIPLLWFFFSHFPRLSATAARPLQP